MAVDQMALPKLLAQQVIAQVLSGRDDSDHLDYLNAAGFQRRSLPGVVGKQTESGNTEILQDRRC